MRFSVVIVVAFVSATLGCGSSGGSGSCQTGRACAAMCQVDADCTGEPNQVCTNQLCGQKPPTSTDYVTCTLDAECSRGDYCSLGVCKHDCLADRDCASGTVCSSRGRCVATTQVGQPTPVTPPAAGKPSVSPSSLDFGSVATTRTLVLANDGDSPVEFRLLSSRKWLTASPCTGRVVKGQPVEIAVTIDRVGAVGDSGVGGFIAVNTSAGYLRVGVGVATELTGSWTGALRVTEPMDLGEQGLAVNVRQSGALLLGWVDAERSPLYPFKSMVSGDVFPDLNGDTVTLSFDIQGPPGTPQNPAFPKAVVRHFSFTGTRTDVGTLQGKFTESFEGVVDGVQTKLGGEAFFSRGGPLPDGQPDSAPGVTVALAGNPMVDGTGAPRPAYQVCASCPGGCSSSPTANADSFLYARDASNNPKVAFYNAFWQAAHSGSATSPFQSIDNCVLSPAQCASAYDATSLRCAQYWAWSGLTSDTTVYGRYLLDTLEVAADYGLYLGNAYTARALDAWYEPNTSSLDQQIALLVLAEQKYVAGLHATDQATPTSLLDPFFAGVVAKLTAGAVAGPASSKLVAPPLNADLATRSTGEQVRRALRSLEAALFAASQRADLQRRMQKDGEAADSVRTAAVRTWIDLGALAPVLATAGSTWAGDIEALRAALRDAVRRYSEVAQGRNMFGYAPVYVPFLWHYTGTDSGTNYTQIKALADLNQSTWSKLYDDAASALRSFESGSSALSGELSNQLATISQQLRDICGALVTDVSQCGASGIGQLSDQSLEVQAALLRISNIETQVANVYASIKIEEDRAAQVAKIHENQAILILKTGERVYADEKAIRTIDAIEKASHSLFGGLLGNLNPISGTLSAIQGIGDAAITGAAAIAREGYEHDKAEALATEQAQVEYNAQQIELVDSAAKVKTDLLQLDTLKLDHDIALVNLDQAYGRLKALWGKAAALLSEQTRVTAVAQQTAWNAIQYRVYANAKVRRAALAMGHALEWSYLATRALEYQLVETYGGWGRLWGVRDAGDLLAYLTDLQGEAGHQRTSQGNRDVISLRDDILGLGTSVKDETTGTQIAPRERFKRFVADPANRDLDGNLHIRFSTDSPASTVFSKAVCSDRIQTVGVNLVGDSLGARVTSGYVKLVHGGTTYLRSCTRGADGTTALIPYDMTASGNGPAVARAHAAINGATDGQTAIDPNVELHERAVLASSWDLVIEAGDNAGLDILGLDDIEITFVHDSYTIQ